MKNEFWIAFTIYGVIILTGSIIAIRLVLVGLGLIRKRKKVTELYETKERKNGQSKGGSRGHY